MPECRDTLLIALTGWGQERDKQRTRDAGFAHHLVKPADPDALLDLLRELPPRD
jgi:CheY-like chemotaxis protein